MARNCKLEDTKAMLPSFLNRHKLTKAYRKALLFHSWHKIVGEDMARQVTPQKLNYKTLHVFIKNPMWANNFQYVKNEVINKINEIVGKKIVEEIVYSRWVARGEIKPKTISKPEVKESFKQRLGKIELSPEDIVKIQMLLKKITNEEVKAKLFKIMTLHAKREKLRVLEAWEECELCGKLIPPEEGGICFKCYKEEQEERASELREIFKIMPSVKYSVIEQDIDCSLQEYNRIKEETVQLWASKLRPGVDYPDKRVKNSTEDYSLEAKMVTCLYRAVPQEELTKNLLARTIRKLKNNTAYWDLPKE